jgi:hypothetical protein
VFIENPEKFHFGHIFVYLPSSPSRVYAFKIEYLGGLNNQLHGALVPRGGAPLRAR